MANILEDIDNQIANLLSGWNIYSFVFLALLGVLVYSFVAVQDPDIHPLILCRQSVTGMIRNQGESAVYRAPDVSHGLPLRSGLNVKLPGDPPYTAGRDGDLRDIWKRVTGELPMPAIRGTPPSTDKPPKILTVFGKEEITDHSIPELSKEISVIGGHIHKHGGSRVAIYLPNSVEFLSTLFGN
jgi:hypothetical protein